MRGIRIGARLRACASFVREGAVLADVGTDHAYLPIFLFASGKIERAVLSDINAGPLAVAEENVRANGFYDRSSLVLCDGAGALAGMGITDYAICGMGGELIADIISRAEQLRDSSVRLILQPMSRVAALRTYLFENGFKILRELYSTEEDKHYVTILAEYTGERVEFSPHEAHFGKEGAASPSQELYD